MAKIKLVENGKDERGAAIERVTKQTYPSKEAARRAATEAGVQDYVDAVAVKSRSKKKAKK